MPLMDREPSAVLTGLMPHSEACPGRAMCPASSWWPGQATALIAIGTNRSLPVTDSRRGSTPSRWATNMGFGSTTRTPAACILSGAVKAEKAAEGYRAFRALKVKQICTQSQRRDRPARVTVLTDSPLRRPSASGAVFPPLWQRL